MSDGSTVQPSLNEILSVKLIPCSGQDHVLAAWPSLSKTTQTVVQILAYPGAGCAGLNNVSDPECLLREKLMLTAGVEQL